MLLNKQKRNALLSVGMFFSVAVVPAAIIPVAPAFAATAHASDSQVQADTLPSYQQDAELIKQTFESQLYTLPAFKMGHYGLRMYRQTQDHKYEAAVWADMARVASRLNYFATEVHTPEQIKAYSAERIARYDKKKDVRSDLRYEETMDQPEYLYLGVDLLGSMARANEYGLKHREDEKLRQVIRRYDFKAFATDHGLIRAWAAQLANQVYWLQQLGEQDVVAEFIEAFKATYPDSQDEQLTDQQFMNKIYGMTHIIFAVAEYYQHSVNEADFQWIYDYYRDNVEQILARSKEDVLAEVGINFLLAGLEDDPVVEKMRKAIQQSIDREAGMVPAVNGSTDLEDGEHRNVLAIMLLDWKGAKEVPTINRDPEMFSSIPYGLVRQ